MKENNKTEESLRFVTRHFEEDTLLPRTGWQQFSVSHHISSSLRRNVAAACIGAVVFAAAASIYYFNTRPDIPATVEKVNVQPTETAVAPEMRIERIEFHDAPLKDVVAEIERIYGVTIGNVPDKDMRLTISYEGTAQDVVETINDLLNLNLTVSSKSDSASRK